MKTKRHKYKINLNKIKKINCAKEKMKDKITDFLEMPKELTQNNTKITLINNKYLYLEGSNKIEDYYKHYIKIKTELFEIILDGKEMEIKEIDEKELIIEGKIYNISYK